MYNDPKINLLIEAATEEIYGALHLGIDINLSNGTRLPSTQKPKVRCTWSLNLALSSGA